MLRSGLLQVLKRSWQVLLIAGMAAPGIAPCQVVFETEELAEEEVEEIRRYFVELVVFEHADESLFGNEIFLPEDLPDEIPVVLPDLRPGELPEYAPIGPVFPPTFGGPGSIFATDLPVAIDDTRFIGNDSPEYRQWLEQQPLEEVPSHILQTQLKVLDPEQHAMQEIYQRLDDLGAYRPIMRAAWTQAVYEKEQTLPIQVRRLGQAPLRLDGVLTLYVSRFLHLIVDLSIDSDTTTAVADGAGQPYSFGDARTQNLFDTGYGLAAAPVRYRIVEDRIFRNGELRYYDHPRFGVLARVTRVEEATEEEAAPDEPLLLPANGGIE